MLTVRVSFSNKARKNSRYFVGVLNETIISLALVGDEMIIVNQPYAPRWLSNISYPTPTRGIIVK